MTLGLGRRQREILTLMRENPHYREWSIDAMWVHGNNHETDRIMRGLARRGLVEVLNERDAYGYGHYRLIENPGATSSG